ncbi:MAG: hypothetical protein AB7K09_10960 [Planctomycetota bacterium]
MRFKARLFPLIDVMILMLGLFLVILSKATLSEDPRDLVDVPEREDAAAADPMSPTSDLRGIVVEYRYETRKWHLLDSDDVLDSEATWLTVLAERGVDPQSVVVIARIKRAFDTTYNNRNRLKSLIGDNCRSIAFDQIPER